MNTELLKILAVIIVTAAFTVMLKAYRPEYAFVLTALTAAEILIFVFKTVYPFISQVRSELSHVGSASVFAVPLKALGIAYISGFTADICRDFGESALASKAELAGKCAVFLLSVPLMMSVLETALKTVK